MQNKLKCWWLNKSEFVKILLGATLSPFAVASLPIFLLGYLGNLVVEFVLEVEDKDSMFNEEDL